MTTNPYRSAAMQAAADAKRRRRPVRLMAVIAMAAGLVIVAGVGALAWMQATRNPTAAAASNSSSVSPSPSPSGSASPDASSPASEPVADPATVAAAQEQAPAPAVTVT
ncbi:hypothetical protein, partial [Propionibacterium freudenreichii]|uniref:hypothetical protein n=1 Tax=Propionibacterium freudenreichii TaxID=1744 RepID=UPI0021A4547B